MNKKTGIIFGLILILVLGYFATTEVLTPEPKTWQMIVDGEEGEGALFYRLTFIDDQVKVKVQAGDKNLTEMKSWTEDNNQIRITSQENAEITLLDDAVMIREGKNQITFKNGFYKGEFNPHYYLLSWIHWVLVIVGLIGLNELFRRHKKIMLAFFIILPIILIPLWMNQGVSHWFKWVKVYSVVFAVLWFSAVRFTNIKHKKWGLFIAGAILAANIGEAASQDFAMGFMPNILNGTAGILSMITLFYGWKGIYVDDSKEHDMIWPKMSLLWILAYDVWNFAFVYLNFPGSASIQFLVIMACTIPALYIKKGTWLQARGFTLAAWFIYYFTVPRFTEAVELMVPRNTALMYGVAIISIVLNVIVMGQFIINVKKDRKEAKENISKKKQLA